MAFFKYVFLFSPKSPLECGARFVRARGPLAKDCLPEFRVGTFAPGCTVAQSCHNKLVCVKASPRGAFFNVAGSGFVVRVCGCAALLAFDKSLSFVSLLTLDEATCMQKFRPLSALCCACSVSSEFPHAAGLQSLAFCYWLGSRLKERFGKRTACILVQVLGLAMRKGLGILLLFLAIALMICFCFAQQEALKRSMLSVQSLPSNARRGFCAPGAPSPRTACQNLG